MPSSSRLPGGLPCHVGVGVFLAMRFESVVRGLEIFWEITHMMASSSARTVRGGATTSGGRASTCWPTPCSSSVGSLVRRVGVRHATSHAPPARD